MADLRGNSDRNPSFPFNEWIDHCMTYDAKSVGEVMSQENLESSYENVVLKVNMIGHIMTHFMNLVLNCLVHQNNNIIADCVRTNELFADCSQFRLQILSALGASDRQAFLELFSETFAEPIRSEFIVATEESMEAMENPTPNKAARLEIAKIIAEAHISILRWEGFFDLDSITDNWEVDFLKEQIEFKEYTSVELVELLVFFESQ